MVKQNCSIMEYYLYFKFLLKRNQKKIKKIKRNQLLIQTLTGMGLQGRVKKIKAKIFIR